jgi:hypothetical protein
MKAGFQCVGSGQDEEIILSLRGRSVGDDHVRHGIPLGSGIAETLEVFVPVGPALMLLMTWSAGPDAQGIIQGQGRHLATANTFTVANADGQWFHEPGSVPWLSEGPRSPLSAELLLHYGAEMARRSPRRWKARALAKAEVAKPLSNDPVAVLSH